MTLCPIAIAASCKKCPVVSFCMLKGIIGDYKAPEKKKAPAKSAKTNTAANPKKKKKA